MCFSMKDSNHKRGLKSVLVFLLVLSGLIIGLSGVNAADNTGDFNLTQTSLNPSDFVMDSLPSDSSSLFSINSTALDAANGKTVVIVIRSTNEDITNLAIYGYDSAKNHMLGGYNPYTQDPPSSEDNLFAMWPSTDAFNGSNLAVWGGDGKNVGAGSMVTLEYVNYTFTYGFQVVRLSGSGDVNLDVFVAEVNSNNNGTNWNKLSPDIYVTVSPTTIPMHVKVFNSNLARGYNTISDAILNAAAGNTVLVSAGTYPETLTITKSLILKGAQAGVNARNRVGGESIISSSDASGSIQINAGAGNTVTIDGFTIGESPAKAIHVNGETGQVNVLNNIIESSSVDGINLYRAVNADVEQNWVKGALTSGITAGDDAGTSDESDGIITNATIKNNLVESSTYGITGYQSGSTISNNEVNGGTAVQGSGIGGQFYSMTVSNNTVHGYSTGAGIAFNNPYSGTSRADSSNVTVSGNNVYENAYGIYVNQSLAEKNIIIGNKNKLTSNSYNVAFDAGASGTLDATQNWWGTTNESLVKSSISSPGNVNYSPWYTDESMTILMDGNPVISGTPSEITKEATSYSGATVSYTLPTATDSSDGEVVVVCDLLPGSTFPLGTTPVMCSATDSDGNTATSIFNVDVVDTTKPTAGIDINSNNLYANSRDVVLTLSYSDSGSGVKECQYKNAGESFTGWISCELTKDWILSEGVDGNRRVYYNVKDNIGNIKESYDDITLDTNPPTLNLENLTVYNNKSLSKSLDVTDGGSGVNNTIVYQDSNFSVDGSGNIINETELLPGTYYLTIVSTDNAQNSNQGTLTLTVLSSNQKLAEGDSVEVGNETEIVFNDQSSGVKNVTIPSSVDKGTEIKLDLTALLNGTNVTLSGGINLSRESDYNYSVEIPSGTVISGGDSWDGKINLPTVKSNSLNSISGGSVNVLIDIGGGVSLNLSNAVKVIIGGQAGKLAAWANGDGTLTQITTLCDSITNPTNINPTGSRECYIDDGTDLVIWTYHFTRFAAYQNSPATTSTSAGGGGSGCLTQWTCTEWSACNSEGIQTRTCSYTSGFCAPASVKPAETQSCVLNNNSTTNPEQNAEGTNSGTTPITGFSVFGENGSLNSRGIGFLIILIVLVVGFMYKNSKSKKKSKKSEKKKE